MKQIHIFSISMILFLHMACKSENKVNQEEITKEKSEPSEKNTLAEINFSDNDTQQLFLNYLNLKNALVASDHQAVKNSATAMNSGLTNNHETLKELLKVITSEKNMELLREIFEQLTVGIEPLLEAGLVSGTIYKQYCPMAFNNNGAFWFSDEKQIANPYFGDKMLRCGSITGKITK